MKKTIFTLSFFGVFLITSVCAMDSNLEIFDELSSEPLGEEERQVPIWTAPSHATSREDEHQVSSRTVPSYEADSLEDLQHILRRMKKLQIQLQEMSMGFEFYKKIIYQLLGERNHKNNQVNTHTLRNSSKKTTRATFTSYKSRFLRSNRFNPTKPSRF